MWWRCSRFRESATAVGARAPPVMSGTGRSPLRERGQLRNEGTVQFTNMQVNTALVCHAHPGAANVGHAAWFGTDTINSRGPQGT